MNPPPPILPASGSTTASANPTATAASTALPPCFKTSIPTWLASGWPDTTMARGPDTATLLPARDQVSGMIGRPVTIASVRAPVGAAAVGTAGAAAAPGARGVVSGGRAPPQPASRARAVSRPWRMLNCSTLTRVRVGVQLGRMRAEQGARRERPGVPPVIDAFLTGWSDYVAYVTF